MRDSSEQAAIGTQLGMSEGIHAAVQALQPSRSAMPSIGAATAFSSL
jgi:hypothetical protein